MLSFIVTFPVGSLPRRPIELAAAQDVEMQVVHALPRIGPDVRDHSIAGLGHSLLLSHVIANQQHMAQERGVSLVRLPEGRNVPAWYDKRVHRGLGVNIAESHYLVILVDNIRPDDTPRQFAEDA